MVHVDYPMLAKNSIDSLEAKDASSSSDLLPLEEELKLRRARDERVREPISVLVPLFVEHFVFKNNLELSMKRQRDRKSSFTYSFNLSSNCDF